MRLTADWFAADGFAANQGGSISVIAGILLSLLMLSVGAGIEMARWHAARGEVRLALDAALLGGARTLQITGGDETRAVSAAVEYLATNVSPIPGLRSRVTFRRGDGAGEIVAEGTIHLETVVLGMLGLRELPVLTAADIAAIRSTTSTAETGGQVEIALALDASRHVGSSLDAVIAGAQDLIDVVTTSGSDGRQRFALVAFADGVTLPPGLAALARGAPRGGTCSTPGCRQLQHADVPCLGEVGTRCLGPLRSISDCTSARAGRHAFTDAPPDVAPLAALYSNRFGACAPSVRAIPLTTDVTAIRSAVSALSADGASAGHLGIAWAWYALAPEWSTFWQNTIGSYARLSRVLPSGARSLRKILVLVTPGTFDRQYCDGVPVDAIDGCQASSGSAVEHARALCWAMRAQGIELFAVHTPGADADAAARLTLRDHCASGSDAYYETRGGDEVRQAMRDIALRIATTRLTH